MCSLADAGEEGADDRATASGAHEDPGDQEVDPHEVSRGVLREAASSLGVALDGLSPGGFVSSSRHNVARGVSASSAESPDKTSDVPGEATAANTETTEGANAATERGADGTADGSKDAGTDREEGLDEAPEEPGDELSVNVGDIRSVGGGGSDLTCEEGVLATDTAVPGLSVGVVEGELAEEHDKGDSSGAAGETDQAHDGGAEATSSLDSGLVVVHSLFCLFKIIIV